MRKNIVAGNWKCNTTVQEGIELAKAVNKAVTENGDAAVDVVICPPFTHITQVVESVDTARIGVGAQNCGAEPKGAFTGEVSAEMVKSTGAAYCILGHSERRAYYGETNEILAKKVTRVLDNGLIPVFCVGEVLEERESGKLFDVIKAQMTDGVFALSADEFKKVVIAYEPVWAIGTGKVATPDQAQEMHHFIRSLIAEKYGKEIAESTSILYGGSCKPSNAKEIFANPDVDGGLIGGAALNAEDFLGIINAF